MKADFDIAAPNYDAIFTNSTIGRMQRDRVWTYLENEFSNQPLRILELNCGTGIDALFLAKMGHHVLATDISAEMVHITKNKIKRAKLEHLIEVRQLDIKSINSNTFDDAFDLVFSDFGGLNCLDNKELSALASMIANILSPTGRIIAVVMPSYNLMESMYCFLKLEWRKIFRRKTSSTKGLRVNVDGVDVPTWYYSSSQFGMIFQNEFSIKNIRAIGFLPSYFENLVHRIPFLLKIDTFLSRYGAFANISDHYLIDLKKK